MPRTTRARRESHPRAAATVEDKPPTTRDAAPPPPAVLSPGVPGAAGGVYPLKSLENPTLPNQSGPSRGIPRNSRGGVSRRRGVAPPDRPSRLSDLHADPENRRSHPARNHQLIKEALTEIGAARSIVIDESGTVIAGNGVLDAAQDLGLQKLRVVDVDGDTIVAVRRRGLTADQKRRLANDNRTAELAEWNPEQLQADADAGLDLVPFFTDAELGAILQADEVAVQRKRLAVARPTEVAWVLVALPLAKWPEHQADVERLQTAAVFTAMAIRGADGKEPPR
jgi:hypothetical protein